MIVIGDVHGNYNLLMELFNKLPQTKDICFVGDLIDRGKDSKKVVDFVIKNNYNCIMGNHEDMLNISCQMGNVGYTHYIWMMNGGNETLKSFNYDLSEYIEWFKNLPLFFEYKNYLISHSFAYNGIKTDKEDVLWERGFSRDYTENIINVFGHTIHKEPTQYHNKHWCIDTGSHSRNVLTAMDLDGYCFYQAKGK